MTAAPQSIQPEGDAPRQLIEAIENADGPSRKLDGAIWATIQGVELLIFENPPSSGEVLSFRGALKHPGIPGVGHYTASIDAAMTLLPPLDDTLRPLTILMGVSENGLRFQVVLKNWRWGAVKSSDRCASYPLALCVAALRARALSMPLEDRS